MLINFASIFVPCYGGAWISCSLAQKEDFVPQDVFQIKVGGFGDFSPLAKYSLITFYVSNILY